MSKALQIRLPQETSEKITETSRRVRLSQNDVIKLALERGLPLLEKALALTGEELSRLEQQPQPVAA